MKILTAAAIALGLSALLSLPVATADRRHPGGGLDCNGHSPISTNPKANMICADRKGEDGERFEDNGIYVGHDEPSMQFLSTVPGSGSTMAYIIQLPAADPVPNASGTSVANFELYPAFWFSLALCDPSSFPFHACTPNSDANSSDVLTGAGSAVLELQFYPPGWPPLVNQISCSGTQWCAALNIDSAELSPACLEPVNFALIQTDGVPAGPPGPGQQTNATFTPNGKTLMMNPGDVIVVIITDSSAGLATGVIDLTTGQTGYMIASASAGFRHTNSSTCATTPFTFHPEFNTASAANMVPWAALQINVNFSGELGHFELGANGDGDADDAPCFSGPTIAGCLALSAGDNDFDGPSYRPDWPDGSSNHPGGVFIYAGGPLATSAFNIQYPQIQFETNVGYTETTTCNILTGAGCTVPPTPTAFYPFYSQGGSGVPGCFFTFGNDVPGVTANDFGRDAQYGSSNASQPALFTSGPRKNPCTP